MQFVKQFLNAKPCPICRENAIGIWLKSDGKLLNPSRCSVCLRTLGTADLTVAQAQEKLARQLEDQP